MALTAPKPRVRQTSTTTGTGTYDLDASIPDAHLGFVAEIGDTNTCHVLVTDSASHGWEWGTYTVADASPDTIARTTVKRSTNGNAAVNWSAGTRTLEVIWPPDVTEMLALLGVDAGAKAGTVTSVAAGTGFSFSTITGSGTIAVDGVLEDLDTLGAVSSDGEIVVGTGSGAFAYESGATARTSLGLGTGDKPGFAGATLSADLTFSGANPEVQGGDTDGVLITSPNTNALGAVVKQYGDTHASKAGDFEFYDDETLVANYDASANKWYFKGIDYTIFDIAGHYGDELDDGLTPIEIISNTGFAFTIDSITYMLSAGAITVDLQIAGSSVTGLNALSVTTSEQTTSASGANAVAAGVDVRMVITSISDSDRNFSFTIHCTRTS